MIRRRAEIRAEADRLLARFRDSGAQPVETTILQSAETLLDLYGEDIRARAYVTSDALRGEQMLRPDFTVPVVQMHMEHGADPARYTYCGEIFRRQDDAEDRPNEYLQVGFEVFDGSDPAAADAEVFAAIHDALAGLSLRATIGDIGLLLAALDAIDTSPARRAALRRHIWRPRRFRALLDRYAGRCAPNPAREALLSSAHPLDGAAPLVGLRSREEIEARIATLRADAQEPPISKTQMDLLDALLGVRETAPFALQYLRDLSVDMPAISPAVTRMTARLEALERCGVDTAKLDFETSYGRSQMEYYDGFVFGFYAEARPDLPPVATGGRYDALTRVLGQGQGIPAVGGVIRPALVAELRA